MLHHVTSYYPPPLFFQINYLFRKSAFDSLFPMDYREFSSPVCYLNYDNYQVLPAKQAEHTVCTSCNSFIAGMNRNTSANEKIEMHGQAPWKGRLVTFILNERGCVYKDTERIDETMSNDCPLCVIISEGLKPEEREELIARREIKERIPEGAVFEFKGEARGKDFWFRLVSAPAKLEPPNEVDGQCYDAIMVSKDSSLNSLDLNAGNKNYLRNSTASG